VYLFEPSRTPFDLSFSLFGIHVRVHPAFWIMAGILGSNQDDPNYVFMWIGVVFISVLIHELGHVLVGQLFGSYGHIVLYGFGGLAIGSSNLNKRWQRNLVYVAGPCAQFLIWGLVEAIIYICITNRFRPSEPALVALGQLRFVNLWWPILNLLPVWPLDGGRISRETFEWLMPRNGTGISLFVSFLVAAFLAITFLAAYKGYPILPYIQGGLLSALFFALFAVNNLLDWQMLRDHSRRPWEEEPPDSW
jgi:stage IV sporulation protein FB